MSDVSEFGAMLQEGRIPMTEAEEAGVDALVEKHKGGAMTFTRRDPGETGPVLVHIDNVTYEVGEDGESVRVAP